MTPWRACYMMIPVTKFKNKGHKQEKLIAVVCSRTPPCRSRRFAQCQHKAKTFIKPPTPSCLALSSEEALKGREEDGEKKKTNRFINLFPH